MDWPFKYGVPYFSREEEASARSIAITRRDKNNVADIYIKQEDTESFALMRRVRKEIAEWKGRAAVRLIVSSTRWLLATDISHSPS